MKVFVILLATASAVSASVVGACNANNCLRAVRGTSNPEISGIADCTTYFSEEFVATVTLPTSTSTITVYATVTPPCIPTYASACGDFVAYSSACSCVGAPQSTYTAPAPTVTATFTSTVTFDTLVYTSQVPLIR